MPIYFIRHGESEANERNLFTRSLSRPFQSNALLPL